MKQFRITLINVGGDVEVEVVATPRSEYGAKKLEEALKANNADNVTANPEDALEVAFGGSVEGGSEDDQTN